MYDIHSCSYYCDRPDCIKAQRDKLRDKVFDRKKDELKAKMREVKKREWVGLTEDEVMQEWFSVTLVAKQDLMKFAKAIEAKLKEKNSWQSVANPTEWLDDLRGGADE